ncbi:MAG: hypothetical protein LBU61_06965 [Coriobacteriales bacterium]|jgi:cell fate regulator YaaT (PSP1 superfamily)|nr:hypothetical protein [Coriobacteriales bacterium]
MSETTSVVAVKLRYSPKAYWFDPVLGEYTVGDQVIVDTERGREVGRVSAVGINATKEQIAALSSPLKPVIRLLDEQDRAQLMRLEEKSEAAMPMFRELIEKSQLEMKAVAIEYLFTGDKAVFYFASESRVDFRELVRDMAARLHIRVELRQIGVRDEARMLGGISHCGEKLCCARMGVEFQPVSIRMAKEQDLPLNPEKISGACGRLMCCLRYEFEAYKDFKNRAPKRGTEIDTPLGAARVIDFDTPREVITLQLEDGMSFSVPLKEFDEKPIDNSEHKRPASVSRSAIERFANSTTMMALSALDRDGLSDDLAFWPGSGSYGSSCGGCSGCGSICGSGLVDPVTQSAGLPSTEEANELRRQRRGRHSSQEPNSEGEQQGGLWQRSTQEHRGSLEQQFVSRIDNRTGQLNNSETEQPTRRPRQRLRQASPEQIDNQASTGSTPDIGQRERLRPGLNSSSLRRAASPKQPGILPKNEITDGRKPRRRHSRTDEE